MSESPRYTPENEQTPNETTISLPKSVRQLNPEAVAEKRDEATSLLSRTSLGLRINSSVQDMDTLVASALETSISQKPEFADSEHVLGIKGALTKKLELGSEIRTSSQEAEELRNKKENLTETQGELARALASADEAIIEPEQANFQSGKSTVNEAVSQSLDRYSELESGITEKIRRLQSERKGINILPSKEFLGSMRELGQVTRVQEGLSSLQEYSEVMTAATITQAETVISAAASYKGPASLALILIEAETMEQIVVDRNKKIRSSARKADRSLNTYLSQRKQEGQVLGEAHHSHETTLNQDIATESANISRQRNSIRNELDSSPPPAETFEQTLSSLRENLQALPTELLTSEALEVYENEETNNIRDPFQRAAFKLIQRTSAEEALGVTLEVTEDGQVTSAELAPGDGGQTPLFSKLVETEAYVSRLVTLLADTQPDDLETVRAITAELQEAKEYRESLQGLAEQRLRNVKLSKTKTKLARGGIVVAESVAITGIVALATEYGLVTPALNKIEGFEEQIGQVSEQMSAVSQQILEIESSGDNLQAVWDQINNIAPELSSDAFTSLQESLTNELLEPSSEGVQNIADYASKLSDLLEQAAHQVELQTQVGDISTKQQEIEDLRTAVGTLEKSIENIEDAIPMYQRISGAAGVAAGVVSMARLGKAYVGSNISRLRNWFKSNNE